MRRPKDRQKAILKRGCPKCGGDKFVLVTREPEKYVCLDCDESFLYEKVESKG